MKTTNELTIDKAKYQMLMNQLTYKPEYNFWGEVVNPNKWLEDKVERLELRVAELEAKKEKGSGHWLKLTD